MNRRGFAPIIIVGIIAVLIIVGVAGYFVWKNSSPQQTSFSNLPAISSSPSSTSTTSPSTAKNRTANTSNASTSPAMGTDLNSTSTIKIQTKTVGNTTYTLTETCDNFEQGICFDELVQLVKSSMASPNILLFSTSTSAYPNPSFDISPYGDFAAIDFTYAGSDVISNISTQDSLIIVSTQKKFLKSFSDIGLTTSKILGEAKGQQGYELALGNPDNPNGCVDHPITWSSDESSISGEICLWNTFVNPAPVIIDSNLFTIDTNSWSVQTNVAQTEGCTLLPYTGNVPLSQVPYYTSGDPDFRGGMTCKFIINPNLPIFTFHFIGNSDNTLGNIQITEGTSTQIIQTIQIGDPGSYGISYDAIAPANYQSILVPVDANFDGYKDLPILNNCGATGNCSYGFYLYSPSTNQFVENSFLTNNIPTPTFDAAKKQVTTSWNSSVADWEADTYQYGNSQYVLVKKIISTWDRNNNVATINTYQLQNGQMELTNSTTTAVF